MDNLIRNFIKNDLLPLATSLKDQDNLIEYGLDSLKMMRLVSFIEDTFEITIPHQNMNLTNFKSIKNITNLIKSLQC
jgi:acyl carrier protein